MKKTVLLIAALLLMAVPAMAVPNVDISCDKDDVNKMVTVSYEVTGSTHLVRAFALDINVTEGVNITDACVVDANYRIFPGQIVITGGSITDYNTPYVPGDIGDSKVTVEMASLYTEDANYEDDANAGFGMKPGLSGTLLTFHVDANCTYKVDQNMVRGGIVMEDPTEQPTVDSPLCSGTIGGEAPPCVVPDIVGELCADAEGLIEAADLIVGDVTTAYSNDVAEDVIISQDPDAETPVVCGSAVDYVCSLGKPHVPNVVGELCVDAPGIITAVDNLAVGDVINTYSNDIAEGVVISQEPVANTEVLIGSDVNYVCSMGKPHVPDVVCLTPAVADTTISGVDSLVPVNGGTEYSNTIGAGLVSSQVPVGGTEVNIGSTVTYKVSLGKPIVPSVLGLTSVAACATITGVDSLVCVNDPCQYSDTVARGLVMIQNPVGGTPVDIGSSVHIVVSMGSNCYVGRPDEAEWIKAGRPLCWCYPRQCKGDADGLADGKSNYWVSQPDLNILKSAWQQANGPVGAPRACADFDHLTDGKSNYRVCSLT